MIDDEKLKLYEKITSKYTNKYGFFTYHPVMQQNPDKGDWDSDNPHLWTGQLNLLLRYHGYFEDLSILDDQLNRFDSTIVSTMVVRGLNARHAPLGIYLDSDEYDAISLDEHDGMFFSSAALASTKDAAILNYGESNGWSFNEKEPFAGAFPKNIKSWINLIKGLGEIIVFAIKNKDFSGSDKMDKVIFKYPELIRLSRVRLGKERAFMRMSIGMKPGLMSYAHLVVSLYYSAKKNKISGHNRSFYRFLVLSNIGYNSYWISRAKKYYVKKMKQMYGDEYIHRITAMYLWNKDNPLHELTKGVSL